jgi:hypothetical protein
MATLTQDEIEFLKSQGLPVPENEPEEAPTSSTAPEVKLIPDELIYGGTEEDWQEYTDSIVQQNTAPETPKVPQETRDSFTYDNLYGEFVDPDDSQLKPKPELSTFDKFGAMWYDVFNAEGAERTDSQKARDQYNQDMAQWQQAAQDLYTGSSFYTEPDSEGVTQPYGRKLYDRYVPVKDEFGNVVEYKSETVIIPDPNMDQSTVNRVIEQAGRNIYQELGGLFTEGAILGDSEFARSRPDMDLSGGEEIAATILSIAAPSVPVVKVFNYGGKLLRYGKEGAKAGQAGYTSGAIGAALTEAIMSKEGDEGLVIKPEVVNTVLPTLNDQQAADVAMFVDGLVVNGVMDGALALLAKPVSFGFNKLSPVKKMANKQALKQSIEDGTLLEIVKYLDPEFDKLNPVDMKLRLSALANVLNNNQTIELALGPAVKEIPVGTTDAIMMGADAYIRETRASLKDTLSPEAFEEMVEKEAARMSTSMIGLLRSQSADPAVQAAVDAVPNEIGNFISETAEDIAGGSVDDAAQGLASEIARQSDETVTTLANQADDVTRQTDEILAAQSTVLEDNPIVIDLLSENTSGGVFTTNSNEVRQALTELVSTEGYGAFKKAMDDVDAAYAALPEATIDAALLKDKLTEITRAANVLDGSGDRAAAVLRDIFEGFEPQTVGRQTDPMPVVGEATSEAIKETPEQVIERLSTELTFKDLYDLKGRLAAVIDSYSGDKTVQRRLIEFRNHITDAEAGQMAHVIDTAPSDVASAFSNADQMYKTAKAEFANSEPVRRLTDKFADQRRFDTERGQIPTEYGRNEPDAILGSNQFVDEVMGDGTGTLMNQLNTMLKGVTSETEINGSFRDLFRAQAANALRDAINRGASTGSTNPEAILFDAVQPVRDQLQALGDTALLGELDTAFNQVRSAYGNLGDIKLSNDQLVREITAEIEAAQAGIVNQLIDTPMGAASVGKVGPSRSTPTSSARQKLTSIMTSENSANRMDELMNKIAQMPDEASRKMATEALQAVALDAVGTKIFGASPVGLKSGTEARRNVALGAVTRLTDDEAGNLFKAMNRVYGVESEMTESVTRLVNMMYQTSLPTRLKGTQAGSDTILNATRDSNIRDAVSTAILLTAGYMNPTAAMLRRITSVPVEQAERLQKEVSAHVLATVVANPKEFERLLIAARDGATPTAQEIAAKIASETANLSVLGTRYEFRVQEEDIFGEEDAYMYDRDMMQLFGLTE